MELGDIQLPEMVVVSGCGPLGLGMVATAKLKNPRKLIALDLLDWKVSMYNPRGGNAPLVVIYLECYTCGWFRGSGPITTYNGE